MLFKCFILVNFSRILLYYNIGRSQILKFVHVHFRKSVRENPDFQRSRGFRNKLPTPALSGNQVQRVHLSRFKKNSAPVVVVCLRTCKNKVQKIFKF
jgi:hypothetical protein